MDDPNQQQIASDLETQEPIEDRPETPVQEQSEVEERSFVLGYN